MKLAINQRKQKIRGKQLEMLSRVDMRGEGVGRIKHPCRMIISGKSQMGKTTLMVDIVKNVMMRGVRRCFAVCPTWYQQSTLAPLRRIKYAFPKKRVFTKATEENFEKIFNIIDKERDYDGNRIPTLLIVDDCAAEQALNRGNHGAFGRLSIASPHLDLSIFCVVQKMTSASPLLRENTEGVISFIPSRVKDIEILTDEFNPCPFYANNRKILLKVLEECWSQERYCFIWREPVTGKVAYYAGLGKKIL